jgi:hypothetical protein
MTRSSALPTTYGEGRRTDSTVARPTDCTVARPTDCTVARPTDSTVARPMDCTVARPTDCTVALPTTYGEGRRTDCTVARPTDSTVARPTDCTVARPTDCTMTRPTDCTVARPTDCTVARCQGQNSYPKNKGLNPPSVKPKNQAKQRQFTTKMNSKNSANSAPKLPFSNAIGYSRFECVCPRSCPAWPFVLGNRQFVRCALADACLGRSSLETATSSAAASLGIPVTRSQWIGQARGNQQKGYSGH